MPHQREPRQAETGGHPSQKETNFWDTLLWLGAKLGFVAGRVKKSIQVGDGSKTRPFRWSVGEGGMVGRDGKYYLRGGALRWKEGRPPERRWLPSEDSRRWVCRCPFLILLIFLFYSRLLKIDDCCWTLRLPLFFAKKGFRFFLYRIYGLCFECSGQELTVNTALIIY